MRYSPGRHDDVIIQTTSAPRHRGRQDESSDSVYDALVYTQLPINFAQSTGPYPEQLRNLPLRGVEKLTIRPQSFVAWLAQFLEGEKGMLMMRERLREVMSPGLRGLLTTVPRGMRIWWNNTTPELDELPWELAAEVGYQHGSHRVAMFRGLPPETPIPALPLRGDPRLGMIGAEWTWPPWARELAGRMGDSVVRGDGPIKGALTQMVSQGTEFVHVFADGIVSSALEGILYDHATPPDGTLIPAGELASLLSGSRVVVLALSAAENVSADTMPMAGREVHSAYRAFAYLGTSPALPTVLAPLGPAPSAMMEQFWTGFYETLTSTWHLTDSLRNAQARFTIPPPIALFSRHAGGKLFQAQRVDSTTRQPMELRASLIQSEQFTSNLSQVGHRYDIELPPSIKELIERESGLQSQLRGELDGAIEEEGEL